MTRDTIVDIAVNVNTSQDLFHEYTSCIQYMAKNRGTAHTTLTETAELVKKILLTLPGIKMIAPGKIAPARAASQRITITITRAGVELLISGQGIQKVAVHTNSSQTTNQIIELLIHSKQLKHFIITTRQRKPGN